MAGKTILADLPVLETERLLLRRMRPEDAEAMFAYASDPEVTRYVLWETHNSIVDTRNFLNFVAESYGRGDFGAWGIVFKETGAFIGTCGFDAGYSPEHARAEVGYALSRDYWGRGIMPEAVRALLRFGFEMLDLNRIESRCILENKASARVMEKAGMVHEGTFREREIIKGFYRDMKVYAILRGEYRDR